VQPKYIDGIEIPRLVLGTSPFIGAGQFGPRAEEYYLHFFPHPENITRLIIEAVDFGITCVQALVYRPITKAIEDARNHTKRDIQIVATVGTRNFDQELDVMKHLGAEVLLTHARITDKLDDYFRECIEQMSNIGVAGAVTHNPGVVIPQLRDYDKVKIIMAPINKSGRFMTPSPQETLEAIKDTNKIVIGKKTLAAGLLPPREALEYVERFVYGVAIGVVSSEELSETFGIAKEIWKI
jgi:hypothetical protein